jgi:hypothetical protein
MRRSNDRRPILIVPAAAVLLAGCSAAALEGQAILRPACAPNDAASVELVVPASSRAYPQLRVTVWRAEVEGTTVTVPGPDGQNGNAFWCTANERCQELTTATVAFGRKRADASVDVTVDARLPDGSRFRKTRRARWQASRFLCG